MFSKKVFVLFFWLLMGIGAIIIRAPSTVLAAPGEKEMAQPPGPAASCPPSIVFGETAQCSINSPAQTDTYTFTAEAGDKVLVRMSKASGNIWPEISVYNPSGSKLCESYSTEAAEIASCTLPEAGTYSLQANDHFLDETGDYYIYLQRLNNPGGLLPIAFGQTLFNSILTPAETKSYTFTANAADKVLVRMSRSSGTTWPEIRVYGADGTKRCEAYSTEAAEISTCTLPAAGKYTILAYDHFLGDTGDYYIYLQRLNNPGGPQPIAFGQTKFGSILTPAETNTYTFIASAADKVLVRMSRSSGTTWPEIRIYGPDGTKRCEAYSTDAAEIATCSLPAAGKYAILAYDHFLGDTGDYYIYLQRLNNPGGSLPILYGQTLAGSILTPAQTDTYSMIASAGDKLMVRMSRSSGTIWPQISVYSPAGLKLCEAYGTASAQIASCSLTTSGKHYILAYDHFMGETGDYNLYVQRLNKPGFPVTISGNAGAAGVTLSYKDGENRSVKSNSGGYYSFMVQNGWSGRVTPSRTGVLSFTPPYRNYAAVAADKSGQNFKINKKVVFVSTAAYDGFLTESTETSGVAGARNSVAPTFFLGDDSLDRQYRALLAFKTAGLPDNAVIISATLRIRKQGGAGVSPFGLLGQLLVDISNPYFGAAPDLQLDDFAAPGLAAGVIGAVPQDDFYLGRINANVLKQIDRRGWTQLRLRFQKDDNDDLSVNRLAFHSGSAATVSYRPTLEIIYYIP